MTTGASCSARPSERAQGEGHVRSEATHQLERRGRGGRRERRLLDPQDRPGDPRRRAVACRRRGVPAATLGDQLERGGALLGDADDAEGRLHPGEGAARDRAALVDDEPRRDPAPAEHLDRLDGGGAADLLVAAEGQPDVLGRRVAGLEQRLDGLADRRDAALVVEGAATPDRRSGGAVVDLGAERVVLPRCLGIDRHDVEVGHQHDRPLGARAGPAEEEPVGADDGEAQPLVQQRELHGQLGQQPVERLRVDARGVAVGDGRDAHERLQRGDHAVGHGQTVVVPGRLHQASQRPRCTTSVRRSRRAGDPFEPESSVRWPTAMAPIGVWSAGMLKADRRSST